MHCNTLVDYQLVELSLPKIVLTSLTIMLTTLTMPHLGDEGLAPFDDIVGIVKTCKRFVVTQSATWVAP